MVSRTRNLGAGEDAGCCGTSLSWASQPEAATLPDVFVARIAADAT